MAAGTAIQVDGAIAEIIDLSTMGAQVVAPRPAQLIRMALGDELGVFRFGGSVAWVSFEIPKGVTRYRAGVEFKDADATALDSLCRRHKA